MRDLVLTVFSGMLALASPGLDASEVLVVPGAAQAQLWSAPVREQVASLAALGTGNDSRLISALNAVAGDPALDPVTRDAIVFGYVAALRRSGSSSVHETVLAWLAAYRPLSFRHHDESNVAVVPLFDVAAAATGLRHELRFRQGFDAVVENPRAAYARSLQIDPGQNAAWLSGASAAVGTLPSQALAELSAASASVPKRALQHDPMAVAVISAGRDADAVIALLADSSAHQAATVLGTTRDTFAPAVAYRVAESALDHPDAGVRSLAMAHAGTLANADPTLAPLWRQRLRDLLTDPEAGATAALQLARLPVAALDGIQADDNDTLLKQRLDLIDRLRAASAGMGADAAELTP